MKISAHTHITNPCSSGYLAYLPAIQSFLDVADEVIVVDGDTTDESLDRLTSLRGYEKLKIISTEQTYWGQGENWGWPQISIQRQTGFDECSGDWVIHFDADHLIPDFEQETLLTALRDLRSKGILYEFRVMGVENGKYVNAKNTKRWCINKKLAKEQKVKIGWGVKQDGSGLLRPIIPQEQRFFVDPVNKAKKFYNVGPLYPLSGTLDVTLYKYGYFFFSSEQLHYKNQRLEKVRARFEGRPPSAVPADGRAYKLVDPRWFLKNNKHPKVFQDFLNDYIRQMPPGEIDIIGLRSYSQSWLQKLFKRA